MKGDINVVVSEVLKGLRKESGLSQKELADYSNVERVYISRIERAISVPSLDVIFKIAKVLKIKPSEFVQLVESSKKLKH